MTTIQYLLKAVLLTAFLASYLGWGADIPELATDYSLRKKYDKINDLLMKHAPWDDSYERNMFVARRLLEKEQSKKGIFFGKKSRKLIKSLQQFIAMDIALQPEMLCTREAVAILRANTLSIDQAESSTRLRKRINIIVGDVVDRYIVNCGIKYDTLFNEVNSNMDAKLDTFLKLFVQPTIFSVMWISEDQEFSVANIVGPTQHFGFAISTMRTLASEDPDAKYLRPRFSENTDEFVVIESKIRRLYEDYIKANCRRFTELTRGLFTQLNQDEFMRERVMGSVDIRLEYNKFRLCDYLGRDETFFPLLVEFLKKFHRVQSVERSSSSGGVIRQLYDEGSSSGDSARPR